MHSRAWAIFAAVSLAAAPAEAQQFSARTELAASSGYLWRGITRHRTPVVQGFGSVGLTGKVDLELSAWASGITGSCGRPSCPEGTGVRIADANASVLAKLTLGHMRVALGANGYHFRPAPFDLADGPASTWEAVASIYAVPSRHLQMSLTTWMDLHAVDGFYAEAALTAPVNLNTGKPPRYFLTATLGFNQGQKTQGANGPLPGYFARNGFTHVSLEASKLLVGPDADGRGTSVQLFVRVQGNFDAATRASVWPFERSGGDQQVILGLAVYPLLAGGDRPPDHR